MSSDVLNTDGTNQCSYASLHDKKSLDTSVHSHNCKSADSLYSWSSTQKSASLSMYKRKPTSRTITSNVAANNEVRQRVLSARMHRIRSYQNQLNDAQLHISELTNENRILRTLHKRQDNALAKYENTNAELPQLLHSHTEEIRMWQARVRTLQMQNKDLGQKMKQKDAVMQGLLDQNKHFQILNTNKNLEERDKLRERVSLLEMRLQEKDDEMKLLARRLQLETKASKSQVNAEQARYRELSHKYGELFKLTGGNASNHESRTSLTFHKNTVAAKTKKIPIKTISPSVVETIPQSSETSNVVSSRDNVSKDVTANSDTLVKMIRNGMGDIKAPQMIAPLFNQSEEIQEESEEIVNDADKIETEYEQNWSDYNGEEEEDEEDEANDDVEDEDIDDNDLSKERMTTEDNKIWKRKTSNIEEIRLDHRTDIVHCATYLDSMCESLDDETNLHIANGSGDGPSIKPFMNKPRSYTPLPVPRSSSIPRHIIDPHKKSQLLQALRTIDSK